MNNTGYTTDQTGRPHTDSTATTGTLLILNMILNGIVYTYLKLLSNEALLAQSLRLLKSLIFIGEIHGSRNDDVTKQQSF